jgi:hypothetical protein
VKNIFAWSHTEHPWRCSYHFTYPICCRKEKMNKRSMAGTIARETKREGQRKVTRRTTYRNKKRKKLVPLMVGSYFTCSPSNFACMQIVISNNIGRSRTSITHQHNLLFSNFACMQIMISNTYGRSRRGITHQHNFLFSNFACMQIVISNTNGRSRRSITHQHNLPLYSRG